MAINKGYLTCDRTAKGDEVYTPFYAVEPLLEFLPKDKTIWCPFDEEWSAFVQLLKEHNYKVINTNLKNLSHYFCQYKVFNLKIVTNIYHKVVNFFASTKELIITQIIILKHILKAIILQVLIFVGIYYHNN